MKDAHKDLRLAMLNSICAGWITEHAFCPWRKWRADFAHEEHGIIVETNGNAYQTKSGGRHGKPPDLQKINAAQALGWRVLQYGTSKNETARMVAEVRAVVSGTGIEQAFKVGMAK